MKCKNLALLAGIFAITFLPLLFSCKKINDATTLGGGLIPIVDNISTFETSLDVDVYNDSFSLLAPNIDSLRIRGSGTTFLLGNITSDPLFGTSTGTIFAQFKPAGFKFSYGFSTPDSLIAFDSVVLVLKYVNTYGDTLSPQSVNVYEVDQSADFRYDTAYLIRENHITYSTLLGSGNYIPQYLDDSIHLFKDSASHQLRIRLDDAFGLRLLSYDSSSTSANNAYYSDSTFNNHFKGFAIVPGGSGNALIGINLVDSKLSVYYKYRHGFTDTAVKNFVFTAAAASANFIQRDYSGSQFANLAGMNPSPQDFGFIQTQPGTFAKIKIHGLDTLSNRIIHRAELIVTQAYDFSDNLFVPPTFLYVDAHDSLNDRFLGIPYDVQLPDASTGSIISTNGGFGFDGKFAVSGANTIREWKFNISRYVQNVVKGTEKAYDLRLSAPYFAKNTFRIGGADYTPSFFVNPVIGAGRVRVFGGTPLTNPQRMRIRIIYSKI